MADQRDPGDENIGRIVPRRYADVGDGEPKRIQFDHDDAHRGGSLHTFDKTEKWDMNPNTPRAEVLGEGAEGTDGAKRFNAGKNRMELIPPEWEWALGDVLTKGAEKYDDRNWEKGLKWSGMIGCMKRHINKFLAGERYDGPEFNIEAGTTGCHHLAMVAWNALALMSYDLREIGENDLPKEVQLELFTRVNAETSDLGEKI